MKKYTNLIILGVLFLLGLIFLGVKYIKIDDVLLAIGYYDKKIDIVNTADIHGHIVFDNATGGYYSLDEVDYIMGMPVMKSVVDSLRKEKSSSLLLDGGDMFHGTNEANIEKGQGVVEIANQMGYTAMTIGNHDFNFGLDRLMEISSCLNFPMLTANIYKEGKPLFKEYEIVEVGGKKIGIFGLTVEDALSFTNSRDTKGVTIESPIKCAEKTVSVLKKQTDAIILISHLGDENDKKLIDKVAGIDLILCGHNHFAYKKADKYKDTYLVEAGGYSTHVGLAKMYFKNGSVKKVVWSLHRTKDSSKADKKAKEIADKYEAIAMKDAQIKVGQTMVKLDGIRFHLRSQETNFGNLLADAMKDIGNADIALMNGGGIRESIPQGEINLYKIGKSLPFVNSLVTVEMSGEKIHSCLERGIRQYPNSGSNGGFLQVSGMSFTFDASKPVGQRVTSVLVNGKPLDNKKYYKVATNDYLYNGGDNYEEIKDSKLISKGTLLKDILAEYIRKKGTINPKVEGRIKVENERYK